MQHDTSARPATAGTRNFACARQFDAHATAPPPRPPMAMGAVGAIEMSAYRVIVTEQRTRGLVDSDGTTYISPPQSEQQARSLIALLAGVTAAVGGGGPWRAPVASGQGIIELERQR